MGFYPLGVIKEPQSQFDMIADALAKGMDFYTKKKLMEESPEYQMAQARLGEFKNQQEAYNRISSRDQGLGDALRIGADPRLLWDESQARQKGMINQAYSDPTGEQAKSRQQLYDMNQLQLEFTRQAQPAQLRGLQLGNSLQEQQIDNAMYRNSPQFRELERRSAELSLKLQQEDMALKRAGINQQWSIAKLNRDMQHDDKMFKIESDMNNTLTEIMGGLQKELLKNQQAKIGWTPTLASNLMFASTQTDRMYAPVYAGQVKASPQGYAAGNALVQANMWSSARRDLEYRGKTKDDPLMRMAMEQEKHWESNLKVFPEILSKYLTYKHAPYEKPEEGFFGKWLPQLIDSLSPNRVTGSIPSDTSQPTRPPFAKW